jgi:hypothetical protein
MIKYMFYTQMITCIFSLSVQSHLYVIMTQYILFLQTIIFNDTGRCNTFYI